MERLIGLYLVLMMAALIIGCSGSTNNTNSNPTKFPEGKDLYISKCTACHRAYERELYTADQWRKILDEMGAKAKLSNYEKEKMLEYLSERN